MLSPSKLKDRLFYGWVVVASFFVIGTVLYGTVQSFGIFFKSIESAFSLTRTMTSAIVSANLILAGIAAFGVGWALDRYGPKAVVLLMGLFTGLSLLLTSQANSPWQLFIAYSLLLSLGTGAVYVVPTSVISRWFDKRRGLALGISGSGAGLGLLIMAPFVTYLIFNFDWRIAYIVIGLIAWAVIIPSSRLLKKEPREVGALPDGVMPNSMGSESKDENIQPIGFSLRQVFSTRNFWFIIFIWLFFGSCVFLVITHFVPHITDIGYSAGEAAGVMSTMGGAAIVGRVLVGIAADRIGRKLTSVLAALLQAGAMLWLIWSQELWMLYLFALVYGFAYSGFSTSMGAFIGDIFGLTRIGAIFGVLEIGFAIGAATGPVLGGLIFDARGSYLMAFLIAASSMLGASLLITLIRRETDGNVPGVTGERMLS